MATETPDLEGHRVVVFGATGNVGHGAALAFLDANASVITPTRRAEGAATLRARLPGTEILVGDMSDPSAAEELSHALGEVDHVFASFGSWWQGGALRDQSPSEWTHVRRMLTDAHVHAATLLLSRVREGGSYTVVTGMGAHHHLAGTSLLFVATGAVLALSTVLREEHRTGPARVNELLIGARIEREARPGVVPSATFGAAAVTIAGSTVRSRVLPYHDPASFGIDD